MTFELKKGQGILTMGHILFYLLKKKEKSSLWQIFGLWSLDFGRLCFCLGEIFRRESEREAGVGGRSGGRRRLTAAFGIWYLRS